MEENKKAQAVPVEYEPAITGINAPNESVASPGTPFTATVVPEENNQQ